MTDINTPAQRTSSTLRQFSLPFVDFIEIQVRCSFVWFVGVASRFASAALGSFADAYCLKRNIGCTPPLSRERVNNEVRIHPQVQSLRETAMAGKRKGEEETDAADASDAGSASPPPKKAKKAPATVRETSQTSCYCILNLTCRFLTRRRLKRRRVDKARKPQKLAQNQPKALLGR